MYWDIQEITIESCYTFQVRFSDGTHGRVRIMPEHMKGVFEPLKDEQFFAKAFIDSGVATWPGEIDLAPDAMYQAIKEKGEWVLS